MAAFSVLRKDYSTMSDPISHPSSAVIALLTDFGLKDNFVGVMKGVISTIAPGIPIIDITHDIAPQDILAGSLALGTSYQYFPAGTVFACVVDPGVGSKRAPIALHAGAWYFVGPDNGLFQLVLEQQTLHAVVALTNATYHLPTVSATFQGRDIFAPAAAHLALGVALKDLGELIAAADLCRLEIARPLQKDDRIEAQILSIDHFGNLITNIPLTLIPDFFTRSDVHLEIPGRQLTITERRGFFAESSNDQEPFLLVDSSGTIAIAIYNGSAARQLGIKRGEAVTLFSAPTALKRSSVS
jgi:S-adenosyl-L-methionine hydrolase (adenosine-forming)